MAEKRMFAKSIVLSDAFLDMPMSARCLYFTLGMLADDEGFVGNPKSIMRQCGAVDDDMKVLLTKRYILAFESGVVVIKHWLINNYLQKERIKPTTYFEERETLELDEKKAYTELKSENLIESGEEKEKKLKFGNEFKNVKLTNSEYQKLIDKYGDEKTKEAIDFFDKYIKEKGYKSKSHYLTIIRWVFDAIDKKNNSKDILDKRAEILETYSSSNNQEFSEDKHNELMRYRNKNGN